MFERVNRLDFINKGGIFMIRRKIASIVLASCLVVNLIPFHYVLAEGSKDKTAVVSSTSEATTISSIDIPASGEVVVTGNSSEANSKDLEKVIKIIKSKISVPAALSEFDYYYNSNSYDLNPIWNLNWSSKEGDQQISVQSDKAGNIISYYYNEGKRNLAPKFLKSELKSKADAFMKKVAANIAGKVKYMDGTSDGVTGGMYVYNYVRVENGIPMPDNAITIGVDFNTGTVKSYSASWLYDISIPSADTKITKEQAKDKIGKKVTMKLTYQNAYKTEADGTTKIKAFLVYTPDNNYIAVDAKTGEVYTSQNEWVINTSTEAAADTASGAKSEGGLTQEEITKLEEMKNLISKDKAIKVITDNKSLLLDKNLNAISAKLYKRSDYNTFGSGNTGTTRYVWSISMNDTREVMNDSKDNYRAYATGEVDAVTGKILGFHASVKSYYDTSSNEWKNVKLSYSMEQGRKTLETFLKAQIPDLFNKSIFTDTSDSYVIAYIDNKEVFGGYNYNYDRVNEDIVYPYNGISGSVDGVTGKIYSYNYNWSDNVTFESPKGAMSPENAFSSYISNEGYHLVYEINNIHNLSNGTSTMNSIKSISTDSYTVSNEVRLVYRTDIDPSSISPFTGKVLNYDGTVYDKNANNYSYSDVNGLLSARNILMLADLGIGFKGGVFNPSQTITVEELTDFLEKSGFYLDHNKIKVNENAAFITRIDTSKLALKVLGYDNVAGIKGIYNIDFKDKSELTSTDLGYAAISWGLDLLKTNSSNEFKPVDRLTRENAADLIIGMLNANND
jgi:hypothetical protein